MEATGRAAPPVMAEVVAPTTISSVVIFETASECFALLVSVGGRLRRLRWARDGTAEQIGVRVVVDRLDLVVLEERITEARESRETITIFAAIFTGARCGWCKQSTQCNRQDQCRSGLVVTFNTVVVIRPSFHLASVAYYLIHVRSERELFRPYRASASPQLTPPRRRRLDGIVFRASVTAQNDDDAFERQFGATMLWRVTLRRRQGKSSLAIESINDRNCRLPRGVIREGNLQTCLETSSRKPVSLLWL
jgi:hypothetical protein